MNLCYRLFTISALIVMQHHLSAQQFDLQGHRGARGLLPENSIPAFKKALELGVTTLEMDVVISGDKKVVVSHEPYFSSEICMNELGRRIDPREEEHLNIFMMTYEHVREFDCGSIGNPEFPGQEQLSVHKPLLAEVIEVCEAYSKKQNRPLPYYNIEIKSEKKKYGEYQPYPDHFTRLVFDVIHEQGLPKERVIIQSFDPEILKSWRKHYPGFALALLIENKKSPQKNIDNLGFTPDIYSPYFKYISKDEVESLHRKDIKVIPWTVNEVEDMREVLSLNVDGLITDYPNRFMEHFPIN